MRRILLLLIAGAAIVAATWYAVRLAGTTSNAKVAALLPQETIFLVHLPSFNRTRQEWQHSDLYRLYREPAVQDFLRKPLAKLPAKSTASEKLQEIEQLDPRDAFLAVTAIDKDTPTFVAGFRFRESEKEAEGIIGKWRSELLGSNSNVKREMVEYERHKIDTFTLGPFRFSSTYDGRWFFASDDLTELKALLDRADQRAKNPNTLDQDETYRAAIAHIPSNYAALFYLQPKTFAEKIQALRAALGSPVSQKERTMLEEMSSICGTIRFEGGKIHDLLFLGMPKMETVAPLTRSSLAIGTKDTVFYLAMLANLGEKIDILSQAPGMGDRFHRIFQTLIDSGVTTDDWKAAFGPEFSSLVNWPATVHWPSILVTLPVIDAGKANKILEAAMRVDEDSVWAQTEKDGVRYFTMQSPASLISIAPTMALSDRLMVVGLDAAAVEAAIGRSRNSATELSNTQDYRSAARSVPPPTNFFAYLDTGLLYTRLDTAVRPLLLMAAAFVPGVNDFVDLNKIPDAEVITKHLSPIVSSQRYEREGYVMESVGPITLNQAALGAAAMAITINLEAKPLQHQQIAPFLSVPSPSPTGTP